MSVPSPIVLPPLVWIACSLVLLGGLLSSVCLTVRQGLNARERGVVAALFAIALCSLVPSLRHAESLRVVPDSLEYAVGALRMFSEGSYSIPLAGRELPPRYPPGFSLLVLLPSYVTLSIPSLGLGVYSVAFLTAFGVPAAYIIGKRLVSDAVGLLSAGLFLLTPGLWAASQEVLTNAPCSAMWLLVLAFLVTRSEFNSRQQSSYLGAGFALLYATACRPLSLILVAAVCLWSYRQKVKKQQAMLLLGPVCALVSGTLGYNYYVFGDPLRSGYNFFCAVPYDYAALTLSFRYLFDNLSPAWSSGVLIAVSLAWLWWHSENHSREQADLYNLAMIAAFSATAFHLVYFYPWTFFYMPSVAVLVPFVAAAVALALRRAGLEVGSKTGWLFLVVIAIGFRLATGILSHPHQRAADLSDRIASVVNGAQAVLITGLPEPFVRHHSQRLSRVEVIPVSRRVEYANKVVAMKRCLHATFSPQEVADVRTLVTAGCPVQEIYPAVATEALSLLRSLVHTGDKRVLIETEYTSVEEQRLLQAHFIFSQVASGVFQLRLEEAAVNGSLTERLGPDVVAAAEE